VLPWPAAQLAILTHSSGLGWAGDLAAFGADFGKPFVDSFGNVAHKASSWCPISVRFRNGTSGQYALKAERQTVRQKIDQAFGD